MSKMLQSHHQAIEYTKRKVLEDLDSYLGEKESLPSYGQYAADRETYIAQIWTNVWLNKATNEVPKKEKKAYLADRGYETENVDRKLINQLFRNEVRDYEPFDTASWITGRFAADHEAWERRYAKARKAFFRQQEAKRLEEERAAALSALTGAVEAAWTQQQTSLYVEIRHGIAKLLQQDLRTANRFYELEHRLISAGPLHANDYRQLRDFMEELTGDIVEYVDWGRVYEEYEQYESRYGEWVESYVYDTLTERLLEQLPAAVKEQYRAAYGKDPAQEVIAASFGDDLGDLAEAYFTALAGEYMEDLLAIAALPFHAAEQREIWERDVARHEVRKAEEEAERKRREEEEARMLKDIFGQEYSTSMERNIRYVLHIGETNTGKTHHALQSMKGAPSGLYLAPLRLLALEVYDRLNKEGIPCSLKTGEEEKTAPGARHMACTVEMFYEKDFYDVVVIDEAQMIADQDRGFSWYRAITRANAREVHIIGSRNIKELLLQILGDAEYELNEYSRDIPLQVESKEFRLSHAEKGDALVCFSRKEVLETAARLKRNKHAVSMIYGSMPPETRKKQIRQFIAGETNIIVATDAIGMGLNLPIRRIVFLKNEKFDGTRRRRLTSQEVKQIAGRAGRKGIYNIGRVAFTADIKDMAKLLEQPDRQVVTFAIAPTAAIFERFQRYSRDLGSFFELWEKFKSPKGTEKATLAQERELYELVRGTELEMRLSMMDLYGFLHLPFSTKDPGMTEQWLQTILAIIHGTELPEPRIKTRTLEDLELSYKAIGLHLLFLYRLGRQTEALYWERLRTEISDGVHTHLQREVKQGEKECRRCGKKLPEEHAHNICDACHAARSRKSYPGRYRGKNSRR
ncbi:helicase-related protein [Ectobacillus ponti]|uniref:RNA helicase n=1 Tax=Ectobacillus ponti TaxID=2961894 RepID=A0AA41X992_9BACI|nr:helicase-related protein [Ectobacillus ponti]MCP8969215.1 RNA helicase [Ectobacillus ponti]